MTQTQQLNLAKDQLTRVLGFFPRVDAKHSVVLAVDTGMLAFLAARAPGWPILQGWLVLFPIAAVVLLAISIWNLYRSASPTLSGGQHSLVYFREIARRTEAAFIDEFRHVSEDAYLKDLLGQIWRNAEI